MTDHRPRVVFLGHGAERTGPPVVLTGLLDWLRRERRVEAHVVLARGGELVDEHRRRADSLTVAARGREPLEPLAAALRRAGAPGAATRAGQAWLRARLRGVPAPDLVYVNTVSPATLALLDALPASAAPVLVHVHELGIGLGSVPPAALARLLARAGRLVAVSGAVADLLADEHGVDRGRITRGPGFVDVAAVAARVAAEDRDGARHRLGASGPGSVVVAAVGLPDWRKAPELALHALWRARRDRPDVDLRLAWIGGDPASEDGRRLAGEAHRLGLSDRLTHLAHHPDPVRLLAGADAVVLPSREDAFPLVALEAAAAGLPVVTFASGGVAELVDAGAGRVVPYPDVAALAGALLELADDPELRRALGAGARRRVADHDVAVGAPRIWAAAEALL